MDLHNPVQSLLTALTHAMETGLCGVPSEAATALLSPGENGTRCRRPHAGDCRVAMFSQAWDAGDVGLPDFDGTRRIEAETVIVLGPQGDACVYIAGQFAYHVLEPNRRFFLDLAAQSLAAASGALAYSGRDDRETESLAYRFEHELSQLRAAMQHEDAARRMAMARMLRAYARLFEQAPPGGQRTMSARGEPPLLAGRPLPAGRCDQGLVQP